MKHMLNPLVRLADGSEGVIRTANASETLTDIQKLPTIVWSPRTETGFSEPHGRSSSDLAGAAIIGWALDGRVIPLEVEIREGMIFQDGVYTGLVVESKYQNGHVSTLIRGGVSSSWPWAVWAMEKRGKRTVAEREIKVQIIRTWPSILQHIIDTLAEHPCPAIEAALGVRP